MKIVESAEQLPCPQASHLTVLKNLEKKKKTDHSPRRWKVLFIVWDLHTGISSVEAATERENKETGANDPKHPHKTITF